MGKNRLYKDRAQPSTGGTLYVGRGAGQLPEEAERATSKNQEQAERRSVPLRHTLTTVPIVKYECHYGLCT